MIIQPCYLVHLCITHGSVILPISKVAFGFAAGGSDFRVEEDEKTTSASAPAGGVKLLPFGGGSGGGVSIRPIAFLVVGREGVRIVPLDNQTHIFEKIIDAAPNLMDRIQRMFQEGSSEGGKKDGGSSQSGKGEVSFTPANPL
ncbi:sporulation protein YtfJ [Paenibacillus spiritus]|uniref:Sporulation protein YtfJ n=1 Tax=Paenibacillus spiritus TaxID=2496557 RepID=A0A5J5GGD6_9BACL|nr:sporulation protein YtfJ [Paenibacillus spiritus]